MTYLVRFDQASPPAVGRCFLALHGKRYTLERVEPYKRKDGASSAVLHWRGECVDCGAGFAVSTGTVVEPVRIRRRCLSCVPVMDRETSRAKYGVAQSRSFALARDVAAGQVPLAPLTLADVTLHRLGLKCVFSFNDRKRRPAMFRDGEVLCGEAPDCDFTPFLATLAKLHDEALRVSLF